MSSVCANCRTCMHILASECAFKDVLSLSMHPHLIPCVHLPSSLLISVHGCELMSVSRTAWSVIKYLCPAAWSGQAHLDSESRCQLPSRSPTTPLSPRGGRSLTFGTSAVGRLIPRDVPCSLPRSISIAAQHLPIGKRAYRWTV